MDTEKLLSRPSNNLGKDFVCRYGGITGTNFAVLSNIFLRIYGTNSWKAHVLGDLTGLSLGFSIASIIFCCRKKRGKSNYVNDNNNSYDSKLIDPGHNL